ncbi:DNA-binding protein [Streptomyces sp. ZL-24]|nr:DNA-binding protein [Streptomyces sp. ZL-24]
MTPPPRADRHHEFKSSCLRVDTSTLRRWRTARPPQGPPFIAVSERVVMYSAIDVEEWLRRRRTVPHRNA